MEPTPAASDVATLGWFQSGADGAYHLYAKQRASGRATWQPVCSWSVRSGVPKTRRTASGHDYCVDCLTRVTDERPIG